jgi:hypothetical protein
VFGRFQKSKGATLAAFQPDLDLPHLRVRQCFRGEPLGQDTYRIRLSGARTLYGQTTAFPIFPAAPGIHACGQLL